MIHNFSILILQSWIIDKNNQETLARARGYFDNNDRKINPNKTMCLHIDNRQNIAKIPVNTDKELEGCYMNEHFREKSRSMQWQIHVNNIYSKAMVTLIYPINIKNRIPAEAKVSAL